MATDDTYAARLLNPTADDIAHASRLRAAREGVVKALEAIAGRLCRWPQYPCAGRPVAEQCATCIARAAVKELREAEGN